MMDIGRQIEEVSKFVDTKSVQESSHVSAVKQNYAEVIKGPSFMKIKKFHELN